MCMETGYQNTSPPLRPVAFVEDEGRKILDEGRKIGRKIVDEGRKDEKTKKEMTKGVGPRLNFTFRNILTHKNCPLCAQN